jgi:predicted permease
MRLERWRYVLPLRLRSLFRRAAADRELDEEIGYHVDRLTEEHQARGLPPDQARRTACLAIGGIEQRKEACRDARRVRLLDDVGRDVRYALRLLASAPGFTIASLLCLALGIGANTAIFSVIDALMLRRLAVADPGRLVTLRYSDDDSGEAATLAYPAFERYRDLDRAFSATAAASSPLDRTTTDGTLDPGQIRVELVSGTYFATLGVAAVRGRALTPDDDRVPGGHPVAVISDAYWTRRYARSPAIIGQTLAIGRTAFTILGVMPAAFSGLWTGLPTDAWVPLAMESEVWVERPNLLTNTGAPWVNLVARLAPGVSAAQASFATNQIFQSDRHVPDSDPRLTARELQQMREARCEVMSLSRGLSPLRPLLALPLAILMAIVGLVLLIACANIANLLLARASTRTREMAIRIAIGAGTGRLVRQLLTEALVLSAIGATLGLLLAVWTTSGLARMISGTLPVALDVGPDGSVLLFTTALGLSSAMLFGLAPASRVFRIRVPSSFVPRQIDSGRSRGWLSLSRILIVTQVAMSLVLLVAAGLFVRTIGNLKAQELGYDRSHVLQIWANPSQQGRTGEALADLWQLVEERLSALPGVRAVTVASQGLLDNSSAGSPVIVPGHLRTDGEEYFVRWILVSPGFFDTVGMRLVSGRPFSPLDTDTTPRVAIVNEAMARDYFGTGSALGKTFSLRYGTGTDIEIVGVAADSAIQSLRTKNQRMIFLPYRQDLGHLRTMVVAVRSSADPAVLAAPVRRALREIDPSLPIRRIESVGSQMDLLLAPERIMAAVSGGFAMLAAVLTCLGLYGVMSYTTARRTQEIGLRVALGATRSEVLGLVFRECLLVGACGIAIGLPAALAAMRLIRSLLFGVEPADPLTIGAAALLMLVVAGCAGFVPARRAARIDPMDALRFE